MKKYYAKKAEAISVKKQREARGEHVQVFKMPKGSRKSGFFAVCSEIEYLNTY